jgi:hypothetical protein
VSGDRGLPVDDLEAIALFTRGELMERNGSPFLTAQWLNLAVLNFEIDPDVLRPLVPEGTELDKWQGRTLVSLVGFVFRDTRVWGLPIPFHRNFPEVNLRFYVRRRTADGWRRGVAFIKEFAPRRAVAWMARRFFGENYTTVRMRSFDVPMDFPGHGLDAPRRASYEWRYAGAEHRLAVTASGVPRYPRQHSEEAFVIEQCWGYSRGALGAGRASCRTLEYRVEHPRWKVWTACEARLDADVARLYGPEFVESLSGRPRSAYLVDGSRVTVFRGVAIPARCASGELSRPFEADSERHTDQTGPIVNRSA